MFNRQCFSLFASEMLAEEILPTWTRHRSPSHKTSVRLCDASVITANPSPHNCNLNLWQANTIRIFHCAMCYVCGCVCDMDTKQNNLIKPPSFINLYVELDQAYAFVHLKRVNRYTIFSVGYRIWYLRSVWANHKSIYSPVYVFANSFYTNCLQHP